MLASPRKKRERTQRCESTHTPSEMDRTYIRRTLELAASAPGRTSPNPMVGAVLVKDSTVVGEGFHLAAVRAHVPDAHEKTTIFCGWYSNRTRGYRKQHGFGATASAPPPVVEDRAPIEVRRSWAQLIRQVHGVDPLHCPRWCVRAHPMSVPTAPVAAFALTQPSASGSILCGS